MTWLRLQTCVLLASLSNAHHWSERKGPARALFFRSHDFVHFVLLGQILLLRARHRGQRIHPQSWYWSMFFVNWSKQYWSMDRVNWMLILTGEVLLVLEAECLKTFQVRFVVLHRLRLCPWTYASVFGKSLVFFTSALVFFPFCHCGLSFLCGDFERSLTRLCGSTPADSSS